MIAAVGKTRRRNQTDIANPDHSYLHLKFLIKIDLNAKYLNRR